VQNSGKERKARMMAVFSTIGIILIVCAGLLFAYQVMAALLGMGTSDSFVYENISLEDILSESSLDWIADISSANLQGLAYTVVTMPLVVLFLFGAMLFFLIHMFKGHKKI
jgi:hypothetical protein